MIMIGNPDLMNMMIIEFFKLIGFIF